MPSVTMTIDQLRLSRLNVRTNIIDCNATEGLERSILAHGLMLPLLVHPLAGKRRGVTLYGVHAGGRRFRSIRALVDRGDLPADWPIEVVVQQLSDTELIERSTAENLLRRNLRPYEEFAAVARAHRRGETVDQIAHALGQERDWVRQRIRLGTLAAPVFAALASGAIGVDQAQAYAATENEVLQLQAFAALDPLPPLAKTPAKIREWLRVGDAEERRLLTFVGDDAYRAAGGGFELDLFNDGADDRGRVDDQGLLRRLSEQKLETIRIGIRRRLGRDIRFIAERPTGEYGIDWQLHVQPAEAGGGGDGDGEGGGDGTGEGAAAIALPAGVVAHIAIEDDGSATTGFWWPSQKARHAATRTSPRQPEFFGRASGAALNVSAGADARKAADAEITEQSGLPADAIQALRSLRRATLRAALLEDAAIGGSLGRDYLTYAMLRHALGPGHRNQLGIRPLDRTEGDGELGRSLVVETRAGRIWNAALAHMAMQPFILTDDAVEGFDVYRFSSGELKGAAQAIVAGLALDRSLDHHDYRIPLHDHLGACLGLNDPATLRALAEPTGQLLDLLPARDRLAIAEPLVEAAEFGPWARARSAEITRRVLDVLAGRANHIRRTMLRAATQWVHPLLRFPAPRDRQPATPIRQTEDAAI